MMPLSAKVTKLILFVAKNVPFLVTKRLRFLAQQYEAKSSIQVEYEEWDDKVQNASLLDKKTDWRGVHFLIPVTKDESKKILNYLKKNGRDINFSLSDRGVDVGFFNSGCQSLGIVSFAGNILFPSMNVALLADSPNYCAVDILHLPNGYAYLSLYVGLNYVATERISNIDVTQIERYEAFASLNPFSKKFQAVVHHDRNNQIEAHVFAVSKRVVKETVDVVLVLLEEWGVKKSKSDFTTVADFSRDSQWPYFVSDGESVPPHRSVIDKDRGLLAASFPGALGEELVSFSLPAELGVDGIFIHSEDRSEIAENDQYLYSRQSGVQKYAVFLYVKSIEKELAVCADSMAHLFNGGSLINKSYFRKVFLWFRGSQSSELGLKILIAQGLRLKVIEERIDALKKSIHLFDHSYIEYLRSHLVYLSERSIDLRGKIESRHDITNAEVQLSNLNWMRSYSRRMMVLVFVQIFLALIVLDWTSKEPDKNLVRKNFQVLTGKFTEELKVDNGSR